MRSTFFGLELGYRGLATSQKALDITGHNMDNAATPGFSRQRAEIIATDPYTYPSFNRVKTAGQIGTGVDVAAVLRIRDTLLDEQIRRDTSTMGYWGSRQQMLDQIEVQLNEPDTDSGNIRTSLDKLWQAFQDLEKDPTTKTTRQLVQEQAISLTEHISSDYQQLKTLRNDTNSRIIGKVSDLNKYATQIADLNDQIGRVTAFGDNPNDLLDKRDKLVEDISKIVNIHCIYDSQNRVSVNIKGISLVDGVIANKIIAVPDPNDENMAQLRWAKLDREVEVTNGELQGLLEIRDKVLPQTTAAYDSLAQMLITEVNALHQTGYGLDGNDGYRFFEGTGALDIRISNDIYNPYVLVDGEPSGWERIAASDTSDGLQMNGKIALLITDVLHVKKLFTNGTATMGEFLEALVAGIGTQSEIAQNKLDHQTVLVENLNTRRESISGVSLDEEMTNMIKFQHGFNAASRVITTMDELLDVIINRLKV